MFNQKRLTLFLFAIILIILLVSSYFNRISYDMTKQKLEKSINTYIEMNLFSDLRPRFGTETIIDYYYSKCVELMNKKYGHSIKGLNINKQIKNNYINLYFVEKDPQNLFKIYKDNCTYTGYKNVIVCDINFIKSNLQNIDKFPKSDEIDNEINELFQVVLLSSLENVQMWVVGHEIGHIAHKHERKYFDFDGKGWKYLNTRNTGDYDPREIQADEFAIEALGSVQLGHFLWMGFNQLIANPQFFGGEVNDKGDIILTKTSSTHPPFT